MGKNENHSRSALKKNSFILVAIFSFILVTVYINRNGQKTVEKKIFEKDLTSMGDGLEAKELFDTVLFSRIILQPIPFSETEIISPFRGAEGWHQSTGKEIIPNPSETHSIKPMDVYHRSELRWDQLEPSEGVYQFDKLDKIFRAAISARQKVGFGIMTQFPGQSDGQMADGARLCYPLYLHQLMQAGPMNERDFISPVDKTCWIPNYNSSHYLNRFEALLHAINKHLEESKSEGIAFKKAVGYIDIRGFGSWGEWHMSGAIDRASDYPAGRRPTSASLIRIIDAHLQAFKDVPLLSVISVFDGERLPNTLVPAEVGYHALTASNQWGKLGWRRDNWGWTEEYISGWLENNNTIHQNMRFDTAIMNRWKYAPILGEGPCGGTHKGGPCAFFDVPRQVKFYHASMIGNGNFCGEHSDIRGRDSMRMAWKLSGYRITPTEVFVPKKIITDSGFTVQIEWQNTGVAPVYENWEIQIQLQDTKTHKPAWIGKSKFSLRGFLPTEKGLKFTDRFTIPSKIPLGNYTLVLKIIDPTRYRNPFILAIKDRRADGGYIIQDNMIIEKK